MNLEYIVKNESEVEKCKEFLKDCVFEKKKLNNEFWFVSLSNKSNSAETAYLLSDINYEIVSNIKPIVLTNESAAYFNKSLYPMINTFERKLRKLLYAASILSSEQNAIKDLEGMSFGDLFELLFLDKEYYKRIKSFINDQKQWKGYEYELKTFISGEKEDALWDKLLPGEVPTLRINFIKIKEYRNDVMHAHNITKQDYSIIRELFKNVNSELDAAIEALADGAFIKKDFNDQLIRAINNRNSLSIGEVGARWYVRHNYGLDEYYTEKDGGTYPVFDCPECGRNSLVNMVDDDCYRCFSCGQVYNKKDIDFCDECGEIYVKYDDDLGMCINCREYKLDKFEKD